MIDPKRYTEGYATERPTLISTTKGFLNYELKALEAGPDSLGGRLTGDNQGRKNSDRDPAT